MSTATSLYCVIHSLMPTCVHPPSPVYILPLTCTLSLSCVQTVCQNQRPCRECCQSIQCIQGYCWCYPTSQKKCAGCAEGCNRVQGHCKNIFQLNFRLYCTFLKLRIPFYEQFNIHLKHFTLFLTKDCRFVYFERILKMS